MSLRCGRSRKLRGFMIVRDYNEPQRQGLDMNAPCKTLGWPNMVLCGRASDVAYPEHSGPLSLKTVRSGCEINKVGKARFAVTPSRYLLLNDKQRHAHAVEDNADVFLVMFRSGLAAEVLASLTTPTEKLLDNPERTCKPLEFFERTYPSDALLTSLLNNLQKRLYEIDFRDLREGQSALETLFHPILGRLLHLHHDVYREIEKLPAVRYATKVEAYRRLWRARDFIEASFLEPIDLARIAEAAELSPHHLLRLFKRVYGETPHQFVTKRRLGYAQFLLEYTDRSVTDICFDIGFESLGSFSTLFKTHLGVSPAHYRMSLLQAA